MTCITMDQKTTMDLMTWACTMDQNPTMKDLNQKKKMVNTNQNTVLNHQNTTILNTS